MGLLISSTLKRLTRKNSYTKTLKIPMNGRGLTKTFKSITMKKITSLPLLLLMFIIPKLNFSQVDTFGCATVFPAQDPLLQIDTTVQGAAKTAVTLKMTIRIFVHIIRRSDGTGGLTTQQVDNAIAIMEDHYLNNISAQRVICFYLIGQDEIHNDDYFNFVDDQTDNDFSQLIQVNSHSDAIDIYFLGANVSYGGRASGIPGNACVVGGTVAETGVLSHEVGHCLGLYHTHSGSGCGDNANCAELADGSNCNLCGDRICDTPADPCLTGKVNSDCIIFTSLGTDDNGDNYSPDPGNIMSYSRPQCLHDFTHQQGTRMYLITTNQIAGVVVPEDLIVPTTTVSSGDHNYAAINTVTVGEGSNTFEQTGGYVEFVAGGSITFKPGTHITSGRAYIQPFTCGGSCKTAYFESQNDDPPAEDNTEKQETVEDKMTNSPAYNYPNPFTNHTHIDYFVKEPSDIVIEIHALNGQKVEELKKLNNHPAGQHTVTLDARKLIAGIYICTIIVNGTEKETLKMTLTR